MAKDKNPLVLQRDVNNPYIIGGSLIFRRMLWDLNPISWISKTRLKRTKGTKIGEKAIIVCNGPSLLKTNLEGLEGVFTFGLNKINLIFDRSAFRPNVIVSVNKLVLEQNQQFFNTTNIPLYLANVASSFIDLRRNVVFLHSSYYRKFAKDVSCSIDEGATVTFVALQLAFHMGFKEVGLIGCDHSFFDKGPENMEVLSKGDDNNHFHPDYFGKGLNWNLPDLFESEISYMMAKKMYEAYNRKIVNCTLGGKLEVFEREKLEDFLKKEII